MKLVVGLGNPGRKYEQTRHNIGWFVLKELARKFGCGNPKKSFHAEVIDANLGGVRTLLLAPHTFMNRSGKSVVAARDFYKMTNEDILIVCDDLNLPLAKIRVRASGSSGGQKGLADVIRMTGTESISRLRIGIGSPPANWDAADYVLRPFEKNEREEINEAVAIASDAVAVWANEGIEVCMNRYNRKD